ncbi:hypothetical protein EDD63_1761 [Breznakia blatticola]|uniref:Integrase catalytic domain-containing protein n=1 Tax=Breznakia blatticola TaxID=1754012 RepID=A0A4R7Z893_9FIRM|nr:hypothetical protein [Breznakia blatticola]TDW08051.1 hypothetical protein EDD63_1761 [Breznakia blatticola]
MTNKYKHLSDIERLSIETLLNEDAKLIDIANSLAKDPRGIKNEIYKHRILDVRKNAKNPCGNQLRCETKHFCTNFCETPTCKRTTRFPYVCNACPDRKECKSPKLFYNHHLAHQDYKENISTSKIGLKYDQASLLKLNEIVSEGVKNGLSLEVIIATFNLDIATSTLYRYIDLNLLTVKNIDLKRKPRYKSKPKKIIHIPVDYDYLKNRTYQDFKTRIFDDPHAEVWEMDTVHGKVGANEKTILSLLHRKSNLQLYFLLDACTQEEVTRVFTSIKLHLGDTLYEKLFSVILTGNGSEFKNPTAIEYSIDGDEKLVSVYYCEPRRSDQKGKCEKIMSIFANASLKVNHKINLARRILTTFPTKLIIIQDRSLISVHHYRCHNLFSMKRYMT